MGSSSMLRALLIIVVALASGAIAPARAGSTAAPEELVKSDLVAEMQAVAPGAVLWVSLHLEMTPGWHTYWRNPGDAGLPTTIDWSLPPGFSAGEIRWPVPRPLVRGNVGSYGYTGALDLLVPITAPKSLAVSRQATLTAEASWLVCEDICIPGGAKLSLSLPVAPVTPLPDPAVAQRFAAARRQLPVPAPFETRFTVSGRNVRLVVPASAFGGLRDPTGIFFPFYDTLIDNAGEPRTERRADGLDIVLKKSATAAAAPATLDGVLVLRAHGNVEQAFNINANPALALRAETGPSWWKALFLAFLGGGVLNAMPCVFPIMSLSS